MGDVLDRLSGALSSVAIKAPVAVASTGNLTLSGYQTIDGVAISSGTTRPVDRRVLVKDQTDAIENGIYQVNSGAWTRTPDFDGNTDFIKGTIIHVANGTTNATRQFRVASSNPPSVGVSEITFSAVGADGLDGSDGTDGLFNGSETIVTPRSTDLIPIQDASNSSSARRATAQNIAETGRETVQLMPFLITQSVTTGDNAGEIMFLVPNRMVGYAMVDVQARHNNAGSGSGDTVIQLRNPTHGDLLSVPLTIDNGDTDSLSAATSAVIKSTITFTSNNAIFVDVDDVPGTTAPKGLLVSMDFQKPATT